MRLAHLRQPSGGYVIVYRRRGIYRWDFINFTTIMGVLEVAMRRSLMNLAGFVLLVTGCSETPQPKPTKSYVLPAEFILDARAVRGPQGEIYIAGSTNFPDGMKMWIQVENGKLPLGAPKVIAGDTNVFLQNGSFRTTGLFKQSKNPNFKPEMEKLPDAKTLKLVTAPFREGDYRLRFSAYFNGAWQSPTVLSALAEDGWKNLRGRLLKLSDPDGIDSDKILDPLGTIKFPP